MTTETRTLKCILTDDEIRQLYEKAGKMTVEDKALALAQVDQIAAKLKTAKASVEAVQAQIDAKLDTANRGWESRQVDCTWRPDREAQVMRLFRSDTGEEIESKPLPAQQTIAGTTESVHVDASKDVREQDVIDVLTEEPMQLKDIEDALFEHADMDQVKRILKRMVGEGRVVQEGKARGTTYRLVSN